MHQNSSGRILILRISQKFSKGGNEVAFGMIGDSSTAEGLFFETMNAIAVLQVPVAVAVWDDGYGISVPKDKQIVKASVSEALEGFRKRKDSNGIEILSAPGWDYPTLIKVFEEGIAKCRAEHLPVLFHIEEMVQPLGHSTAGSHARYKPQERLDWELEFDPLVKMEEWLLENKISNPDDLEKIKKRASTNARNARNRAWNEYSSTINKERDELLAIIDNRTCDCKQEGVDKLGILSRDLKRIRNPIRKDIQSTAKRIMRNLCHTCPVRSELQAGISDWLDKYKALNFERYSTSLYNDTERSALKVEASTSIIWSGS